MNPPLGTTSDPQPLPHEWLEARAMRAASDAGLGVVLLLAAAVAYPVVTDLDLGHASRPGPGLFPIVIVLMLLIAGGATLLRAVLLRERADTRWSMKSAAGLGIVAVCVCLSAWWWGEHLAAGFSPPKWFSAPEWAVLLALVLSVMIVLARVSRLRAVGMALLGLLLGTVGVDVNTGAPRLMFGQEALADGLSLEAALLGFVIGDAALCATSPSLLLALYARKFGVRFTSRMPKADTLARIAGAIAVAGGLLYVANAFDDIEPIVQVVVFAVFGIACQFLDWNRLIFWVALLIGPLLEESIRRTALIWQGDLTSFLSRPVGAALLVAVAAILAIAFALSLRRAIGAAR